MGVGYTLANATKQEALFFVHVGAEKAREIAGNPAASAIICWYLLQNQGDEIQFVSDSYDDWPFSSGSKRDLTSYTDMTDVIINSLIAEGVLKDFGISWADEDEPDVSYVRDIRNIWMTDDLPPIDGTR